MTILSLAKFFRLPFGKRAQIESKYAFILCPPYCGSTLMSHILASSENVSINNPQGTREGQTLPEVRDHLFVKDRWNEDLQIDWKMVKRVWEKYWDLSRPILLEKSPPNILRANQIASHFQPAYFFAAWRNPYAHCESQIRRNGSNPKQAADFAIRCLQIQRRNIEQLDNVLPISYEELTADPASFVQQANRLLPELGDLRVTGQFNVHNMLDQPLDIKNLNCEKIALLGNRQRREINAVFGKHRSIFDYFGYRLLD